MITIICHDVGCAEILASYVAQNNVDYQFVLEGPAIDVFSRRFGDMEISALRESINQSDWRLCATSSASDLEWNAIEIAKMEKKHCVVYLDHWNNYSERFRRHGIDHFPDEIWVGDEYAFSIAKKILPNIDLKFVVNPYFKDIKEKIAKIPNKGKSNSLNGSRYLYVSENISTSDFKQDDSIRFFIENIQHISPIVSQIVIRSHPLESNEKYYWVSDEYDLPIKYSNGSTLLDEIIDSDIVVGCSTMAMVVGLLAERRVISCIPDNKAPLILPFEGIEILSNVIEQNFL